MNVDAYNNPLAIVQNFPSSLATALRDGDNLFVSETLYEPVELGFSAYIGVDMIHTRAYF